MEVWETRRCLHCILTYHTQKGDDYWKRFQISLFCLCPSDQCIVHCILLKNTYTNKYLKKIRRQLKLIIPRFSGALMHLHRFLSAWNPFSHHSFVPYPLHSWAEHFCFVTHRSTSDLCSFIPHYCLSVPDLGVSCFLSSSMNCGRKTC